MARRDLVVVGICVMLISGLLALNPRIVMPSGWSYSGPFETSRYGYLVQGFADLMKILFAGGTACLVIAAVKVPQRSADGNSDANA